MSFDLSIVTAVCGQTEVTAQWLDNTIRLCNSPHELIFVSNGSIPEDNKKLNSWANDLRANGWSVQMWNFPHPLGTTYSFDFGARRSHGEIVAMFHNDLFVYEDDWDKSVIDFFNDNTDLGVCGFAGAKSIGSNQLYKTPYQLEQLARHDVHSSLRDWNVHGSLAREPTQVMVLDGLALILKRGVYLRAGGLDLKYIHHMYDNDLCLVAHYSNLKNFVLPISCFHRGGMTSCGSEYSEWAKSFGGDTEIHRRSHEYFYEKWRGKIPVSVI